jgi:hypothetical protein
MSARATPAGRRAARALVAIAWLAAGAAFAQDPRSVAVQNAARDWLAQTDRLDAARSFEAAGANFRKPLTVEQWTDALSKARAPLGAVVQRTVVETAFDRMKTESGVEEDVAVVRYRTAFANKVASSESVTLEREADGTWRVIGYFIR